MTTTVHDPDQIRQIRQAAQALADCAEALEEARHYTATPSTIQRRIESLAQAAYDLYSMPSLRMLSSTTPCAMREAVADRMTVKR